MDKFIIVFFLLALGIFILFGALAFLGTKKVIEEQDEYQDDYSGTF